VKQWNVIVHVLDANLLKNLIIWCECGCIMNTLTNSRSNMSLSSCLLVTLMSNTKTFAHTRSNHNKEDDDLQLLISPFITARKIAGICWVKISGFQFVI